MKTGLLSGIVLAAAAPLAAPAHGEAMQDRQGRCGMYPPGVYDLAYSAWSDCRLRRAGEKPLWQGLDDPDHRRHVRFTFTDGHSRYTRVIDFVERFDGTGRVKLKTLVPGKSGELRIIGRRRVKISAPDVARLDELALASDAWKFEIGSWDGEEIYLHCQLLELEKADSSGYRYSSVNISCNRPRKLEPLLDFVTNLVGLHMDRASY